MAERKKNYRLPCLSLYNPLMKYRNVTLAESSCRNLKQNLLSPHKHIFKTKTGNVWLYKGCLINREAKMRSESNVAGIFHEIS